MYKLNYDDKQDFTDALRGRVEMNYPDTIGNSSNPIWDLSKYDFIPNIAKTEDYNPDNVPHTVNKSLWRQAQLNKIHGLFKVCDGVYQFRGYDIANVTFIEDKNGVVVIDCATARETAETALGLYRQHRGNKDVKAVILTHSHADHYGGILGIIGDNTDIPIYAPEGFVTESALENALVGDAMSRRASYMYGTFLKADTTGHVDSGLGKAITVGGDTGFFEQTVTVVPFTQKKCCRFIHECVPINIAGGEIHFEFMLCPNTEAPAEMTVFIHEKRLLVGAEILNHTMHNILTPRGAEVRDARLWWKAVDKIISCYPNVSTICATHNWPIWNSDENGKSYHGNRCKVFLEEQRDTYKFLHDQTVRLINKGYTMTELTDYFNNLDNLPDFMKDRWHNRGYYGTLSFNVRAIYQKYLGWYDMHPSNLNPLSPKEAATEYIKAMGGESNVINIINTAISENNLRWAAEVGKHLVLANPSSVNRIKLANIFTPLGFQSESATWRDMYLTGAMELLNNGPLNPDGISTANSAILSTIDDELFYDYVASRLNGEKAASITTAFAVTMECGTFLLEVKNGVLNFHPSGKKEFSSFYVSRLDFIDYLLGKLSTDELMTKITDIRFTTKEEIEEFLNLFDKPYPPFNIVLPKKF